MLSKKTSQQLRRFLVENLYQVKPQKKQPDILGSAAIIMFVIAATGTLLALALCI